MRTVASVGPSSSPPAPGCTSSANDSSRSRPRPGGRRGRCARRRRRSARRAAPALTAARRASGSGARLAPPAAAACRTIASPIVGVIDSATRARSLLICLRVAAVAFADVTTVSSNRFKVGVDLEDDDGGRGGRGGALGAHSRPTVGRLACRSGAAKRAAALAPVPVARRRIDVSIAGVTYVWRSSTASSGGGGGRGPPATGTRTSGSCSWSSATVCVCRSSCSTSSDAQVRQPTRSRARAPTQKQRPTARRSTALSDEMKPSEPDSTMTSASRCKNAAKSAFLFGLLSTAMRGIELPKKRANLQSCRRRTSDSFCNSRGGNTLQTRAAKSANDMAEVVDESNHAEPLSTLRTDIDASTTSNRPVTTRTGRPGPTSTCA